LIPVIVTAAILLPVLLTGCGKKDQQGEKKTVQKSEDDFLDEDAKPDERKYLVAAKPFFIAVASRKYADA
jgi:major membrane immunogen (membrane-anchored lipoprotein)